MTITFAGHSLVPAKNKVKEMVKLQIRAAMRGAGSVTCYLGGYGDFDEICACACRELKQEYIGIEVVYVTPFISLSEQAKIKEMQRCGLCDTSIYPPLENTLPKFAILKKNEWMIANADPVIAYVSCNYGGAYQSLRTAKRKKKNIINIYDFLSSSQK